MEILDIPSQRINENVKHLQEELCNLNGAVYFLSTEKISFQ